MSNNVTRRGFMGHVGGAFAATAIVGGTAVAVSDLRNMEVLEAYSQWLFNEQRLLMDEMYPEFAGRKLRGAPNSSLAEGFHFPAEGWQSVPKPSTRAGLVLKSIGLIV